MSEWSRGKPSGRAGLVRAAAGLEVGAFPGCQDAAALRLLRERPFVRPAVPVQRPPLPLADVAVQDVLNVLHDQVYGNCREERGIQDIEGSPGLELSRKCGASTALLNSSFNKPLSETACCLQ